MLNQLSSIALSLILTGVAHADTAEITSEIDLEVKAATVIDGKGGIFKWSATGSVSASDAWKSIGQVVMMPKSLFMVSLNLAYHPSGGSVAEALHPKLGEKPEFTKIQNDLYTFEYQGQPAVVRVFNGKEYLYATVEKLGKMPPADAKDEMIKLMQSLELQRS
ncbi:MAG: hypothetical protein ACQKBU_02055 [Verrucomicrobiales bacterium]